MSEAIINTKYLMQVLLPQIEWRYKCIYALLLPFPLVWTNEKYEGIF